MTIGVDDQVSLFMGYKLISLVAPRLSLLAASGIMQALLGTVGSGVGSLSVQLCWPKTPIRPKVHRSEWITLLGYRG